MECKKMERRKSMENFTRGGIGRIECLTSLRGIAIFTIFLSHLSFWGETKFNVVKDVFSYARLGVDFFFLLSGFLIAAQYSEKFNEKTITYVSFVKKRIQRIYPLYIVIILLCVPNYLYLNFKAHTLSTVDFAIRLVTSVFMVQAAIPFGDFSRSFAGAGATWFISCIFILYLITPILLKLNNRIKNNLRRLLTSIFVNIFLFIFVYSGFHYLEYVRFPDSDLFLVYSTPYIRIFFYVGGMLIFDLYKLLKRYLMDRFDNFSFCEVILAIGAVSWWLSGNVLPIPVVLGEVFNLCLASLIIFVYSFERGLCSKGLKRKCFLKFGNISMEFYLIHYTLINIGYRILSNYIETSVTAAIVYSIIFFVLTVVLAKYAHEITDRFLRKN